MFLARLMPYVMQGLTIEQAGLKVLARDKELFAEITEQTEQAAAIKQELCKQVYNQVKGASK